MSKSLLERAVEDRFFSNLINQEDSFENSAVKTYQNLVFFRYEEVIKNSFPLFIEQVDKDLLKESIKAFMKNTPTTPFIWQIPNDFRKFVKKENFFGKDRYFYELLYFDWVEIELYMKEYPLNKKKKTFSYKNSYKLSSSARIKRFKYDIVNRNFSSKEENFLVIYYDFSTNEVLYRQINPLIYELLKKLNGKTSIEKILQKLCKENDIDFKEAKKVLKNPLKELFLNSVFYQK